MQPHTHPSLSGTGAPLLHALNKAATVLQKSFKNQENVYDAFREQVIDIGLRGGLSFLDESGENLTFQVIAYSTHFLKFLSSVEKHIGIRAKGYSVPVNKVDVYATVIEKAETLYVPNTSTIFAQVIPKTTKSIVQPLLSKLGSPPGIFTPLIQGDKVIGMVNIVGPNLTIDDTLAMQAFANHIAIALENAQLFQTLQEAKEEIDKAYNATLEGWIQALELRDREIIGHTLRAADATVRLAQYVGCESENIPAIRRGVLLHDIGKVGIPDHILHKPSALNESEWKKMKQHPVMAYQWLSKIDYLGPSLDIPYRHHERWDGSGYPDGLAGEKIPHAARLFTVVDVWDAMRSDRPYRKAISEKKVVNYLKKNSGILFDPKIVTAFLEMLTLEGDPIQI